MGNQISAIIIDQREPNHIRALFPGAAVQLLDAGDLWVATSDNALLVIERKTPSDLLNTLSAGRLFPQIARMRELSPWCYLLIEKNIHWQIEDGKVIVDYKTTGWDMAAVQGALITVQELGCAVVYCNGEHDLAAAVDRLAKRERGNIYITSPRPPRVLSSGEQILAALPGIGPDKALALMKHCGTPAWALSHLTRLGENGVAGINDGIKRAVRKALELEDGMELHPVSKEQ